MYFLGIVFLYYGVVCFFVSFAFRSCLFHNSCKHGVELVFESLYAFNHVAEFYYYFLQEHYAIPVCFSTGSGYVVVAFCRLI